MLPEDFEDQFSEHSCFNSVPPTGRCRTQLFQQCSVFSGGCRTLLFQQCSAFGGGANFCKYSVLDRVSLVECVVLDCVSLVERVCMRSFRS